MADYIENISRHRRKSPPSIERPAAPHTNMAQYETEIALRANRDE